MLILCLSRAFLNTAVHLNRTQIRLKRIANCGPKRDLLSGQTGNVSLRQGNVSLRPELLPQRHPKQQPSTEPDNFNADPCKYDSLIMHYSSANSRHLSKAVRSSDVSSSTNFAPQCSAPFPFPLSLMPSSYFLRQNKKIPSVHITDSSRIGLFNHRFVPSESSANGILPLRL